MSRQSFFFISATHIDRMKQSEKKRDPTEMQSSTTNGTIRAMFNPPFETRRILMKTGTRRILIALTSATLLLGGLTACGTRGPGGPGGWSDARVTEMSGKMVERIGDKLDLNAEQKLKLEAVATEMQAQRKAFRGDSANPRDDFKALIAGDKFDRAGAQALLEQKTAAVQQQGPKVLTALADFYDSLTPEQQQQVRERLDRGGGWGWGRRGPGF